MLDRQTKHADSRVKSGHWRIAFPTRKPFRTYMLVRVSLPWKSTARSCPSGNVCTSACVHLTSRANPSSSSRPRTALEGRFNMVVRGRRSSGSSAQYGRQNREICAVGWKTDFPGWEEIEWFSADDNGLEHAKVSDRSRGQLPSIGMSVLFCSRLQDL